jgi:hypothetical protein
VNIGHFYCLKDQYFIDFPDPMLMRNREKLRVLEANDTVIGKLNNKQKLTKNSQPQEQRFLALRVPTPIREPSFNPSQVD